MANKRRNKSETKHQQAAASPKVSPRWLARSVAKGWNGGKLDKYWRLRVAKLPRTGRSRIYPKIARAEE